ncbi:hypothetical protein BaRGS_00012811 [Batillaria attramentaria]|uniref:Uncharacterized protein n=1 Tax=Batillaria attramentaria TaxID=370345 RepID=A0ABD0L8D3_9CAEN
MTVERVDLMSAWPDRKGGGREAHVDRKTRQISGEGGWEPTCITWVAGRKADRGDSTQEPVTRDGNGRQPRMLWQQDFCPLDPVPQTAPCDGTTTGKTIQVLTLQSFTNLAKPAIQVLTLQSFTNLAKPAIQVLTLQSSTNLAKPAIQVLTLQSFTNLAKPAIQVLTLQSFTNLAKPAIQVLTLQSFTNLAKPAIQVLTLQSSTNLAKPAIQVLTLQSFTNLAKPAIQVLTLQSSTNLAKPAHRNWKAFSWEHHDVVASYD